MEKFLSYLAIALGIVTMMLSGCEYTATGPQVCFDSGCFDVEVANTPETREQGLMHRERLSPDEGMLFIFDEPGNYRFWMKNTYIILDMIWIDSTGKVVYIQKHAEPCTADPCEIYDPETNALYVLEVLGGMAAEKGVEVGDYADIYLQ